MYTVINLIQVRSHFLMIFLIALSMFFASSHFSITSRVWVAGTHECCVHHSCHARIKQRPSQWVTNMLWLRGPLVLKRMICIKCENFCWGDYIWWTPAQFFSVNRNTYALVLRSFKSSCPNFLIPHVPSLWLQSAPESHTVSFCPPTMECQVSCAGSFQPSDSLFFRFKWIFCTVADRSNVSCASDVLPADIVWSRVVIFAVDSVHPGRQFITVAICFHFMDYCMFTDLLQIVGMTPIEALKHEVVQYNIHFSLFDLVVSLTLAFALPWHRIIEWD